MTEPPAELWVRPNARRHWYQTAFPDQPDAVRYVRADLYDKRMAENVTEAPCLEPLGKLGKVRRGFAALLDFGPYRPL